MKIKLPLKKNKTQLVNFFKGFKDAEINKMIKASKVKDLDLNKKMFKQKTSYKPQLNDLYRLYDFIVKNRRLCVLEIGCGWSSLVINKALAKNKKEFSKKLSKIRNFNKFKHFSLDNDKFYIKKIKSKTNNNNISSFIFSKCRLAKMNYNIVCEFEKLPNINPDFIYIDGPDIFKINGKINNISYKSPDRIPIFADILKIEYQLLPGTIILMDGRTTNARFLKDNFKRNWRYVHDFKNDQNFFILDENPIGKHNLNQLKFYGFL